MCCGPLFQRGVLLADEVGLGKTIEAGLVLTQLWAERRRRLLVTCPAALRKQWALELAEKFNLSATVMDAKTYRETQTGGSLGPFDLPGAGNASTFSKSRIRLPKSGTS